MEEKRREGGLLFHHRDTRSLVKTDRSLIWRYMCKYVTCIKVDERRRYSAFSQLIEHLA